MKYKVLLFTTLSLLTTVFAGNAKNILSLKESITDNAIVYPSSFETDTKEMMENWYLKNYAIIDQSNIESRNYGEVSDAEYIRRLKKLPTVIEMPFNQIVKSYIERYVKRGRTLVAQMLGMCPYYMPIFEEALERHQMPLELKYIPIIESALNPTAVSPAGAGGLWQFMVATAKGNGLQVNSIIDERRDPYRSSEKAAVYFKKLYDTYHDWSLAIAAYNCGPGNVNKAIRRTGTEHPDFWEIYNYLPKETRGYVPAFIAANYVFTYYREHNINPTLTKKPLVIDTVQVNKRIYFSQISQVLNIPIEEIRILNPQYRNDVIPGDAQPYSLALPSQQIYSYIMAEDKIANYHKRQFEPREVVQPGDIRSIVDDEVFDGGNSKIVFHEVTDDEDFIDIADRYGMQYDDLMELNDLSSTNLKKGQILKVIRKGNYNDETVMGGSNSSNNGYNSYNNSGNQSMASNTPTYQQNPNNYSGHYDGDHRNVPPRNNPPQQATPTVPPRNNQAQQQNDDELRRQQEAAAAKKREEEAARKRQEAAAAKKRQEAAAAKKRQEEEAAKKKREEEAAKKKREEEARKKREAAAKPINHKVKEGDNLTRLATQYGVSIEEIKKANNLSNDNIQIGKDIVIPKKGQAAAAAKQQAQPAKQQAQPAKQQGKQQQAAQPAKQQGKQQATQTTGKQGKQQQAAQPAKQQGKQQATQTTGKQGKQQQATQSTGKGKGANNTTVQPNKKK